MTTTDLLRDLQGRIQDHSSDARRGWWHRYLRGSAVFRGTAMADVRAALHAWVGDHGLSASEPDQQVNLALALLRETPTEDKLAGVLFFQEILLPAGRPDFRELLPAFAALFEEHHLADWNAVDWFCVKVLGPLVERDGEPCARAVAAWREGATLWQRRASAVAFVNLVGRGEVVPGLHAMVLESCRTLVSDPERFSQTGAGWVLREMSRAAPERVEGFLLEHGPRMSAEALKSATKKLPEATRTHLVQLHRTRPAGAG